MRIREGRVIYLRMLADLLHNAHRAYYPELRFTEGVEVTMISNAIFLAQEDGKPFTVYGLSKHLDIPRATLLRRLKYLERTGYICRDNRRRLLIDTAIFGAPQHARNLPLALRIITEAADALSKMDA